MKSPADDDNYLRRAIVHSGEMWAGQPFSLLSYFFATGVGPSGKFFS
jgi:hypothetical protein